MSPETRAFTPIAGCIWTLSAFNPSSLKNPLRSATTTGNSNRPRLGVPIITRSAAVAGGSNFGVRHSANNTAMTIALRFMGSPQLEKFEQSSATGTRLFDLDRLERPPGRRLRGGHD